MRSTSSRSHVYCDDTVFPKIKNARIFAKIQSRGEQYFKNVEISSMPAIRTHPAFFPYPTTYLPHTFLWNFRHPERDHRHAKFRIESEECARTVSTFCTSHISSRCFNIPLTQRQTVSAGVFALKILKRAEGRRKNTHARARACKHTYVFAHKKGGEREEQNRTSMAAQSAFVRIPRD